MSNDRHDSRTPPTQVRTPRNGWGLTAGQWQTIALAVILAAVLLATTLPPVLKGLG